MFCIKNKIPLIDSRIQRHQFVFNLTLFSCDQSTHFGFRQGLQQRSVSREALEPRMTVDWQSKTRNNKCIKTRERLKTYYNSAVAY
jgi:hypothetical protein